MDDILGRAKRLGIKFEDEEEKEHLEQLSALQELLDDAEHQRASLDQEGTKQRCTIGSLTKFGRK